MRFASVLLAARGNPKEPVPFQEILPLKLKRGVSGKADKVSEVSCIHEMTLLFACFKNNEFNQSPCVKEIESFQKCYNNHLEVVKIKKERGTKGILSPGEKKLSAKQINVLLGKFPNIK